MNHMFRVVDAIVKVILIVLLILVVATVVLQIVFRFILAKPLSWSEELSRYLFVWIVYLGGYIGVRKGSQLGITVVVERLPVKLSRIVSLSSRLLTIIYLAIVSQQGILLSMRVMRQPSAVMHVPMGIVYAAIPTGMLLMLVASVQSLIISIRSKER